MTSVGWYKGRFQTAPRDAMKSEDHLAAKLLGCCAVTNAWLLSIGVGALGLLTMAAIG